MRWRGEDREQFVLGSGHVNVFPVQKDGARCAVDHQSTESLDPFRSRLDRDRRTFVQTVPPSMSAEGTIARVEQGNGGFVAVLQEVRLAFHLPSITGFGPDMHASSGRMPSN
jgi:hypothetical protein